MMRKTRPRRQPAAARCRQPWAALALAWALGWAAGGSAALAQPAVSRGQLLYEIHCAGCHGAQIHWRDKKVATDWAGLLAQVQLWQARDQLNWNDADVQAVAGYLNDTIYRLPRPEQRAGLARPR